MFNFKLAFTICLCRLLLPAFCFSQQVVEPMSESLATTGKHLSAKPGPDLSAVAKEIVAKTNAFRQEEKRPVVAINSKLVKTAEYFAKFMAQTNKFAHNADGNQPADRVKKFGYEYCLVAENIAYEYDSSGFTSDELAKKFFEGWKKSAGHRKNMLDPDVTETGVAVAQSEETHYFYAVQVFSRPKSMSITFQITNEADKVVHYELDGEAFSLPPEFTRTHERCRPGEFTLNPPDDAKESTNDRKTWRPTNGEHFFIRKENGSYEVKR